jgi:hypothetical protein
MQLLFAHFAHGVRRTLSSKVYTMQLPEVLRSYDNSDIMTLPSVVKLSSQTYTTSESCDIHIS